MRATTTTTTTTRDAAAAHTSRPSLFDNNSVRFTPRPLFYSSFRFFFFRRFSTAVYAAAIILSSRSLLSYRNNVILLLLPTAAVRSRYVLTCIDARLRARNRDSIRRRGGTDVRVSRSRALFWKTRPSGRNGRNGTPRYIYTVIVFRVTVFIGSINSDNWLGSNN